MSRADSPLTGRMIFNLGSRRSGTYWLQRIVTANPLIGEVPSETHLFSHGVAPLVERFQHEEPASAELGTTYADRDAMLDAVRDVCDLAFVVHLGDGQQYVSERTPLHVHHIELIASLYPDARFAHIIRDGRDVVRSLLTHKWGPKTPVAAAEEWRDAVRAGLRWRSMPRFHELRYEDMLSDPEREVRRLYETWELDPDPGAIDAALRAASVPVNKDPQRTPVGTGKWKGALSARDVVDVEAVIGDLLEELGYDRSSSADGRRFALRPRPRR